MTHKDIALLLRRKFELPGWWCQMVAVAYGREWGKRESHERQAGFGISRSRTIAVPYDIVYEAWSDAKIRSRWLPNATFVIRKSILSKSLRVIWRDGKTEVGADFRTETGKKSYIVVQQKTNCNREPGETVTSLLRKEIGQAREYS